MNSDPVTVGVIYDGNGHQREDGSSSYTLADNTVQPSSFVADGCVLTGWNTARDVSGQTYHLGDSISYPSGGSITLYAQWAWGINLEVSWGDLSIYIVDSQQNPTVVVAGTSILPSDGRAGLMVEGPSGTTWTHDGNGKFTGVNGSTGYKLTLEITSGGTVHNYDLYSGNPGMIFTYDGPVYGSVTYLSGTHIPTDA